MGVKGMNMQTEEVFTLDSQSLRVTSNGYLVAEPRVARTGIQLYSGVQCGRPGVETVRVYRPESTVFDKASMQTFAYQPITYGHPENMVNANNWRDLAVGNTGGDVARDGEYLRVPLVIMDARAIEKIRNENRELSVGYFSDLDWTPGKTPSGEMYDAVQSNIKVNHIAVVSRARGGPELRLGDKELEDDMSDVKMKRITLDGLSVDVSEFAASVIEREYSKLSDQLQSLKKQVDAQTTELADLKTQVQTKDGEIAVHKKTIEDSKLTPEVLMKAVNARASVIQKASKILGDGFDYDSKYDADIKRAAVAKRLGDAAATMEDAVIHGAFLALDATSTPGVASPPTSVGGGNILASAFNTRAPASVVDAAYDERKKRLENAWKN
jgi:hypothetical protein